MMAGSESRYCLGCKGTVVIIDGGFVYLIFCIEFYTYRKVPEQVTVL